ncbi:MAG: DUF4328 domain-containing protein [Nannocystales bacterium]
MRPRCRIIVDEMSESHGANPYAPPVDDAAPQSLVAGAVGYRDQGTRLSVVGVFLALFVLASLASMWSCMAANEFVPAVFSILEPRELGQQGIDVLRVVSVCGVLLSAIAIGAFLVRANHNARALGGPEHGMTVSPGWTVGWFFIPFANWVRPYQAVREIWNVSEPERSGPVALWWGLWLTVSFGGRVVARISNTAETWEEIARANWLNFVHSGVSIAAAVAVFLVVRGLHENQQRHVSRLQRAD